MAHAFWFFTHIMMSNDLFAFFYLWDFLWRNLVMGEYSFFFFLLTLFKLGCLCWSVWYVAFHVETLLLIRLSKSIYKFGYRFIGQHIGYRLSNIKNYRCRPKLSYRCIRNFYIQKSIVLLNFLLEIDRYIGLPIFSPIFKHFTIIGYQYWKK